jgi:hypothetical protein
MDGLQVDGGLCEHRNRHNIEKTLTMFLDLYILSGIVFVNCDSACVVLDAER